MEHAVSSVFCSYFCGTTNPGRPNQKFKKCVLKASLALDSSEYNNEEFAKGLAVSVSPFGAKYIAVTANNYAFNNTISEQKNRVWSTVRGCFDVRIPSSAGVLTDRS